MQMKNNPRNSALRNQYLVIWNCTLKKEKDKMVLKCQGFLKVSCSSHHLFFNPKMLNVLDEVILHHEWMVVALSTLYLPSWRILWHRSRECPSVFWILIPSQSMLSLPSWIIANLSSKLLSWSSFQELIKMLELVHLYFSKVSGEKNLIIFLPRI